MLGTGLNCELTASDVTVADTQVNHTSPRGLGIVTDCLSSFGRVCQIVVTTKETSQSTLLGGYLFRPGLSSSVCHLLGGCVLTVDVQDFSTQLGSSFLSVLHTDLY